jgi:hypothetical protein
MQRTIPSKILPIHNVFNFRITLNLGKGREAPNTLLHIVPFYEGPNKKSEGFAKEKQKT